MNAISTASAYLFAGESFGPLMGGRVSDGVARKDTIVSPCAVVCSEVVFETIRNWP